MSVKLCIEEAKKMIKEEENQSRIGWDHEDHIDSSSRRDSLRELIERLEKLPEEDGWISVEDRLPEKDGYYYVINGDKVHPCFFNNKRKLWNQVSLGEMFHDFKHVTHWHNPPITK